jgi:hypothetical protein
MADTEKFRVSKLATPGTAGKSGQSRTTTNAFPRNAHSHVLRQDCAKAGVHIAPFAGIAGSAEHGAYSVVLSAGYEDDVDRGDVL